MSLHSDLSSFAVGRCVGDGRVRGKRIDRGGPVELFAAVVAVRRRVPDGARVDIGVYAGREVIRRHGAPHEPASGEDAEKRGCEHGGRKPGSKHEAKHPPIVASATENRANVAPPGEMKNTNDAVRVHEDVVVLVPGFLGFSLIGHFPYFADRVPATLAGLLCERWGRDISLVPASTVPTGSLRARVQELGRFLARLESLGAKRLYLAGHSTGGVDAQLLGCTAPFWGGAWEPAVASARQKIQSVVTISAPHHGTCLVASRVVQFLSHPRASELGAFLKALSPLVSLAGKDVTQIGSILELAPQQWPDVWRFLYSVLRHHELLEELRPEAMAVLRASVTADPRIALTCFATGADVQLGPDRTSDGFYVELHGFGVDEAPSAQVRANLARLSDAPASLWIHSPETPALRVTPNSNDGVVNTARQILDGAEIGGVAVADHADVLGDYDRVDIATGQPMNTGIFRSGAEFGDDQFVELYRRVARALDRRAQ